MGGKKRISVKESQRPSIIKEKVQQVLKDGVGSLKNSKMSFFSGSSNSLLNPREITSKDRQKICKKTLNIAGYKLAENTKNEPCEIVSELIKIHVQYINANAGTTTSDIPSYDSIKAALFNCGTLETNQSLDSSGKFTRIIETWGNESTKKARGEWCYAHDTLRPKEKTIGMAMLNMFRDSARGSKSTRKM